MDQISMDKKNQSRPLCKHNELAKNCSDYSTKKNGPSYPRKRESEKFDNGKKASTSRGGRSGQRYVRPREKMGGQVELKDSDFGSFQRSAGKKQSITHLLNWWGPGPGQSSRRNQSESNACGFKSRRLNIFQTKYNKELYLQANCQFIVSAGHDYSAYLKDPDHLVNWELVEEVRLHVSEFPSCPICLYLPVAAKVTKCGHIFCYPCILHYLALTDEKWCKCPICFDAVSKTELKSVITILHKEFTSSQEIELMLMKRERNSLIPIPASCLHPSLSENPVTLSSPDDLLSHSKLIVASMNEVTKLIVAREKGELQKQMILEGDQPEACFIEEALSLVSMREISLIEDLKDESTNPEDHQIWQSFGSVCEEDSFKCDAKDDRYFLEEVKMFQPTENEHSDIIERNLQITQLQTDGGPLNQGMKGCPKATFYFYQESSGATIYLHALNVHMLIKEYGSLQNCPNLIRAKVLEKESDSMTDLLRQRLRYLRHLPITCPFEVVEIEMKPPLVSAVTLAEYKDQLDYRACKRIKRAKAEHQIEKRVQVEEDRLMGRSRGLKINATSLRHFPSFKDHSFMNDRFEKEKKYFLKANSFEATAVLKNDVPCSGVSFAQMIRCGKHKDKQEEFPSLHSGSVASNEVTISEVITNNGYRADDENEAEKAPDFSLTFSSAFAKALDQVGEKVSDLSVSEDLFQHGRNGKKRKKKKKEVLLLSSGGR